jgi:hypothetical protein
MRFRELAINYELPKSCLQVKSVQGVSVGLVGRNLALWLPKTSFIRTLILEETMISCRVTLQVFQMQQ